MKPVIVIGAGWSGAVVAHSLVERGVAVEVLERSNMIGGHSRVEQLCGVTFEPNGPHILHTSRPDVARFFDQLELGRPFRFRPQTEIELSDGSMQLMSWPIQVDELEQLPDWKLIERQLSELPAQPSGHDFESYAISLMGQRLYELFIEGYTRKQWGCDPSQLSSSFAPKRIDLRRDGYRDLFRDAWQAWPANGVNGAIESLLRDVRVTCGADVTAPDMISSGAAAIVVTAALDDFVNQPDALPWRGVHLRSTYHPCMISDELLRSTTCEATVTPAYVINRPSLSVPYTRTIESKHASGQHCHGTVVSMEYPGARAKHYPVIDLYGKNEKINAYLQAEVRTVVAPIPVFFTGRLATYRYINQDEAIADAWKCADEVARALA